MFIKKTELISAPFFLEGKVLVDFLNPNVAVFYRIYMVLKSYGKGFVFHSGYAAVGRTIGSSFAQLDISVDFHSIVENGKCAGILPFFRFQIRVSGILYRRSAIFQGAGKR